MKLKVFNMGTVRNQQRTAKIPFVQVNAKAGVFTINRAAAELIGVTDGDQVQFLQDEEDPAAWYIEKVKTGGFTIRFKESAGLLFNSTELARIIFESVNCKYKSGRMLLGDRVNSLKGRIMFTLVTASLNAYKGE
ncbi:MAG TPA: hypothetical protein PKE63_02855 [Lacibacter sp.]|nr:hypothetical protein [Lacibacter sp.]HMO89550.1 hypothetical protein [Lacibacter sp.]HMP86185.1 hypothetical protein [Lacibacter sp.]